MADAGRAACQKDPPNAGGWNAFLTAWATADVMNPVSTAYVNAACDKASFGWPCDETMEKLRDDFARKTTPPSRRRSRKRCNCASSSTRPEIPVGEFVQPAAMRKNVKGLLIARCRCSGTWKSRSDMKATGGGFPLPVLLSRIRSMYGYLFRRLLGTIPVMLVVAIFIFLMLRLTPSDPAAIIAGDNATTEQVAKIRSQLGLDRPMVEQFFIWSGKVLSGDFGESFFFKKTVASLIGERIEPTLSLALITMLLAVLIAVPLGVLAAHRHGSWIDRIVMGFSVLGFSMPSFVIGYLLIYLFAVWLDWLPVQGYQRISEGLGGWLRGLVLPSLTLSIIFVALIARMTRTSMLEVLSEDYIRTARAKGQSERIVLFRHALRNAAVPIVTVIGLSVALLIGGVVVTESVFTIPGLGRLTVDAVLARDYPTIQAVILLFSFVYVMINLAVDMIYTLLDPRIRY